MNLVRRYAPGFVLVTLLLGSTGAVASAATGLKGSFALPSEAYWGNTLLPPGDYQFSVNREITGVTLINLEGEGLHATLLAPIESYQESRKNCLRLEEINGTYVVRELVSTVPGNSFRFSVPKRVRDRQERSAAAPAKLEIPTSGL